MSFKVQVRRAAELDLAAAQSWYEAQSRGLGVEFHSEIAKVFARLSETPLIYPAVHKDVRRVVVQRFPYLIWYRLVEQEVTILACTHGRQDQNRTISGF